ncbi:hypothetical protein QTP88_001598 [Uroleucon formosanum]
MTNPTDFWPVWSIKTILGSSDGFERAFEKLSTVMQFNYSECDTEIEALAKSQRQIRAKKIIIVLIRTNLLPFHRKTNNSYYILYATTSRNVVYLNIPSPSIFQESLSQLNKRKIKTRETSSTVLSDNSSKRAACHTLFTDKSPSPVNRKTNISKDGKTIGLVKRSTRSIFSDESPSPVNKITRNIQETSSTVLSKNSFKRAACRTLFTDKSPSPVNRNARTIGLVKRSTHGIFSDESPSPVNKITKNTLETSSTSKRAAYHNLFTEESPSPMNKTQNSRIIFNQERIFNQLAVNGNNCPEKSLENEHSIHYKTFPLKDNDDLDYIEGLLNDDSFYQYLVR